MAFTQPPGPYSSNVEVLFRTGVIVHRLPESTATLLAENLRAWPLEAEGWSQSAADKIELVLVEESAEPIELEDSERVVVRKALEVLMAGPHDSPALREFSECLGIEPRPRG